MDLAGDVVDTFFAHLSEDDVMSDLDTSSSTAYTLYGASGSGSMVVEAALALAGAPVRIIDVPWEQTGWESSVLKDLNPLGQLPTLLLPSGEVMTESAAIVLHVADRSPGTNLAPPADHPDRTAFLRWLVFLVSAVYPTFTYGDVPKRWVDGDEEAGKKLRKGTDEHRQMLWRYLEGIVGEPWFLGETFSALDVYIWLMRWWRPGREWFAAECPRLDAVGRRSEALPAVAQVQGRNFPPK
jgi:GST-like protein